MYISFSLRSLMFVTIWGVLIAFLFNIPLMGGVSTSNLALCMSFFLLFCYVLSLNKSSISVLASIVGGFIVIALSMIAALGVISMAKSSSSFILKDAAVSLSWYILGIMWFFGYWSSEYIFSRAARKFVLVINVVLIFYTFVILVWVARWGVTDYRYNVNSYLPTGINGFLFSITWLQAYMLGTILDYRETRKVKRVAKLIMISVLMIGIFLGSRQFLFAILALIFLGWIMVEQVRDKVRLIFVSLFGVLTILVLVLSSDFTSEAISQRVGQTMRQLDSGSERLRIWSEAIALIDANGLVGKGVGYAREEIGHAVDNFYLEFIIDYGYLALVILALSVALYLITTGLMLRQIRARVHAPVEFILWLVLLLSFFWFANFNEIIREYSLWIFAGALFGRLDHLIREGRSSIGRELRDMERANR